MGVHDRAAILSTGDELLIGQILDTNSRFLAEALTARGIVPVEHVTVGDDLPALVATLRRLCDAAPLVVVSGGLGPTDGDLTRAALAQLLGDALVEDAPARAALEARLAARGRAVTPRQLRQAQRPASARCLPNPHGTAPGLHVQARSSDGTPIDVFCLPGPPAELKPMWETSVIPALRPDPDRGVATRLLHVVGLAESDAAERLGPLTARDRVPLVGITASGAVLTVRIRYEGSGGAAAATESVARAEAEVRARLDGFVFGGGDQTLESAVLDALAGQARTLALAESCTGGLLGAMLSAVPGASASLVGGWMTYANQMKSGQLGVSEATLTEHGAVSQAVAREMALGALDRSRADHALSITGIAGPGGGSEAKPVGTVFVGLASRGRGTGSAASVAEVRRFWFPGRRDEVRLRAARSALAMLWFALSSTPPETLLWQVGPTSPPRG